MICKNSSGGSVDVAIVAGGAVDDDDLGKLLREFFSLYALSKMSPVAAKMSPVWGCLSNTLAFPSVRRRS
jgi:hypothetical protein